MKKEILKLTGLTEDEFYRMYPTQEAFTTAYPGYKMKMGGLPEAFPQIATADNFFSYGVPVPPTYYMHGGPTVYPQIQTEAQFFSPVYSNSNNAYAVGGSYMEAYPQAKVYPQGPVGGSSFYMMQDGGQGMPEPQKDQTFYTQKMNSFFDKLRQASYKNLQSGIMNSEPDTTSAMPELSMGRRGGMLSYQGNTSTSQTTTPAAAAAAPAATTPNFQTVTGADGQSYLVGPNNQLYSPYKGNQTTTTNTQQQVYNPYPYRNRNGVYVGTGLDNVANFLIPNNQRERYRNITEQQGKGISNLSEDQLKAILSGSANVSEFDLKTRWALLPKNRTVKSLNVKFRNPVTGQMQTAAVDPASPAATSPATTTTTPSTTNPATSTTTNPAATTTSTTPTATTQAAPKDVELDDGSYVTADEAKAKGYTQNPNGSWSKASTAASTTPQQDVNAAVAQMQADARAKGMNILSSGNPESDEDLLPADERMKMQSEKDAIDEQFNNYDNYKKIRDMQIRQGKTPDQFDFNRNYDYGSKAASPKGTVDYTPKQNTAFSNKAQTTTATRQLPSNTNSMDAATAQKKASMRNPNVNQAFIDAMTGQAAASGAPYRTPVGPVIEMNEQTGATYRLGGPYVLPMYQGMVGPSQVDEEAFGPYAAGLGEAPQEPIDPSMSPYGPYADGYRFEPEQDEFEIGLDFGRTKTAGVNPYLPAGLRMLADMRNRAIDDKNAKKYMGKMSRADQVFETFDQFRGDYAMNTPAGANFRPDQMVPVGYTGAGYKEAAPMAQQGGPMMFDVADLFFLTPQMLKKTTSRR